MFSKLLLLALLAIASACPPSTAPPSAGDTTSGRLQDSPPQTTPKANIGGQKKRSVGCNPGDLIIEGVTKMPFGTSEENEKNALMIRSKILQLIDELKVETEKYGEYVRSDTSNNGFLTVQYTFGNAVQNCEDFMRFGEIGAEKIAEFDKVIVTCGCDKPKIFQ